MIWEGKQVEGEVAVCVGGTMRGVETIGDNGTYDEKCWWYLISIVDEQTTVNGDAMKVGTFE